MAYGKHIVSALRHPLRMLSILQTVLIWLKTYFETQVALRWEAPASPHG